ncbi:LysE/ArgO family amino acid transporter [Profundibacterium mesophilum]|uniref:LysE family transporter n=1 Tax=Profundibacterium mesophilum KAUST100406-0324 TaxID=1037889 RepID=A0A921NS32_9RHOB|nr:LysE/ArgO family amino acid transporter [Profundibacterium mesophilum]KAF0675409.1 LysE family transporter [Profundibacterium mesophilum KAUST100406-0324]
MNAFVAGFALGLSLILAIGAQNAFVLRQGLKRAHVFVVCLTCAVSDAVLIAAGVGGLGWIVSGAPWLISLLTWGGAAFLFIYGARAFRAALRGGERLEAEGRGAGSARDAILSVLALTWLNPHVYLDTVVLLGSIANGYPDARPAFAAGAMLASFVFFFSLGYGAILLAPLFARPRAWQLLDLFVGSVMWLIAASLLLG